jgi:hypothetical protein
MGIRSFCRYGVTAVALAALVVTAAGCNGDSEASPEPLPSASSSSPPSSPTTSPTATPSGWESEFTEEQLAEYQAALGRWEDYQRESEPIWSDPKPTAETLQFFAGYFYNEDLIQNRLEQYAEGKVRVEGLPSILWSKALSIRGKSVTIRQCFDPANVRVTQDGHLIPNSNTPILREIDLSLPQGQSDYLIQQIHDPSWGRKEEPCAA